MIELLSIVRLENETDAWRCADLMATSEPWLTLRRDRDGAYAAITSASRETYVGLIDGGVVGFPICLAAWARREQRILSLRRTRVAVIGVGGVGGYYSGLLARAGHDIFALARGASLAALRERRLVVRTPDEKWNAAITVSDDAGELSGSFE
jgi:glutamate dehydrogenase/leucine dehydrogenase